MAWLREAGLLAVGAVLALYLQGCGQSAPKPKGNFCEGGPKPGANCADMGCCGTEHMSCFKKDDSWASCMETCTKGPHPEDPKEYRTPWSCEVVESKVKGGTTKTTTALPQPKGWVAGTWTTGYWDCCKPSCSWAGKGNVNKPVQACDARTGKALTNLSEVSVCQGGYAGVCADQIPFGINSGLSMGFAAAAVGSKKLGLMGDENCGMCYELRFTDEKHKDGNWGGSADDLVGKRMIIQVTNIGKDVTGEHSFDIMIPGAGLGLFKKGCPKQFPGTKQDDFDCGKAYGGCDDIAGCDKLPHELQDGCKWRYKWYKWLTQDGKTNNPYVQFHRVKCPHQLTSISGTIPKDDDEHQVVI